MSLDVTLTAIGPTEVFTSNITHNLGAMAQAAGIYECCWRPEQNGISKAQQLIEPLKKGLDWLRGHEVEARAHDAPNGWGTYEHFVPWVENYLKACRDNPDADVSASR